MKGIAAIGEVMIELAPHSGKLKELSYAGDTYNTAIYLARQRVPTAYVTRLGQDCYSQDIISILRNEGIDDDLIECQQGAQPGLYIIHNTPQGEREFAYWRREAPARKLFSDQSLCLPLMRFAQIYLSGITLAIISNTARQRLYKFLDRYRAAGGQVIFDSNFRPRLWSGTEAAQAAAAAMLIRTDIALLTLEDEQLLWGDMGVEAALARLRQFELAELVLKRGAEDTFVVHNGISSQVPVQKVSQVVDTTAAGDSFNAGYLAARHVGGTPVEAAAQGARCAAIVIQSKGAILPREQFLAQLQKASSPAKQ